MDTPQNTNGNPAVITGDWDAQSKELKAKYPQLTDADLKFEPGKEQEVITHIQSRLEKKRPEVIELLRAGRIEKQ